MTPGYSPAAKIDGIAAQKQAFAAAYALMRTGFRGALTAERGAKREWRTKRKEKRHPWWDTVFFWRRHPDSDRG